MSWQVVITLAEDGSTGQLEAPSLQCVAALAAVGPATSRELHLHQVTTADPLNHCADAAELTLIINASAGIDLLWQASDSASNTATAALVRDQAPHVGS